MAIIYDNLVHGKSVLQLIQEYGMNYSTIKHVLLQYHKHGKTDIRKYRPYNYVPSKNDDQILRNSEHSNDSFIDADEEPIGQEEGKLE